MSDATREALERALETHLQDEARKGTQPMVSNYVIFCASQYFEEGAIQGVTNYSYWVSQHSAWYHTFGLMEAVGALMKNDFLSEPDALGDDDNE